MRGRSGRPPGAVAITLALGLVAVVLGFLGYRDANPSLDISGALYQAIQLLVLDYHGPPVNPPWELEVGRYLAAVVLAYALFSVLLVVARERADALRLRLVTRNHSVVVGLGTRGASVLSRLRSDRQAVAVIESDRAAPRLPGARSDGATVVLGDARDPKILDKAQVARASNVLVVAGDDSTNLEILAACEQQFEQAASRTRMYVAIDDRYLWAQLHRRSLEREERSGRVEFLSFPDRVATKLIDGAREELAASGVHRLLVWGSGPVALRTAVHAVRRLLLSGRSPELALGGPDPDALRKELLSHDPWVEEVAGASIGEPTKTEFQLGLVAGLREAEALAAAARLSEARSNALLVVQAPHDMSERSLIEAGYDLARVRLVAAEHDALDPNLFAESALDVIARAKHEDYVSQEIDREVRPADNPSITSWDELPASLQASNRHFAESVGQKLADLGAELRPLTSARPDEGFVLTASQLEELAHAEHDRWVRDLLADGWEVTEGAKDPARKLHPLLLSWEELDEEARQKDRDPIRALPEMLARVGYQIELRDPGLPRPR